ncbi:DUF5360 family protein [Nonomuraea sp. NPDC048882]|uniref:DUF5360 family protein n=1 Tax=Nonomuraea sp. NPDC048882 TaxID=3154347 RepID=UPI00340B09F8
MNVPRPRTTASPSPEPVPACLPATVVSNAELSDRMHVAPEWIEERTGIRERRVATDSEATWAFADYANPLMIDWNWSFLWIDLLASTTGLTSLWLLRRGRVSGPPPMLVSLVLTMASGLMAIAFWTLRRDFSLTWWIPNLYLMLFPVPGIICLTSQPVGSRA